MIILGKHEPFQILRFLTKFPKRFLQVYLQPLNLKDCKQLLNKEHNGINSEGHRLDPLVIYNARVLDLSRFLYALLGDFLNIPIW